MKEDEVGGIDPIIRVWNLDKVVNYINLQKITIFMIAFSRGMAFPAMSFLYSILRLRKPNPYLKARQMINFKVTKQDTLFSKEF